MIQKQHEGQGRAPQSDDLALQVCQPEAQVSQGDGAPNGHEVPVIGAGLHDGAHAALQRCSPGLEAGRSVSGFAAPSKWEDPSRTLDLKSPSKREDPSRTLDLKSPR